MILDEFVNIPVIGQFVAKIIENAKEHLNNPNP